VLPTQIKTLQNPGTRRHPAPYLKTVFGFRQKKSLSFPVLLVLSSWSFKEPGQQDDQDEENKLLDFGKNETLLL
jgi:hypothetical protein